MKCQITPENIVSLPANTVFVFGSNQAGRHGGGAAHTALQWGAKMGQGFGFQGRTYAVPTKDYQIQTLPLPEIETSVKQLLYDVSVNPHLHFLITKIGCGLAGLTVDQVAPMFRDFLELDNCSLPQEFIDTIKQATKENRAD